MLKYILLEIVSCILLIGGAYLLMVSAVIIDLEVSCGLSNISVPSAIKLLLLLLFGISCVIVSVIIKVNTDTLKTLEE